MQTFYRWRKEFGGLKLDQAKGLKELEKEKSKLKRLGAELSLEKQVLYGHRGGKLLGQSGDSGILPALRLGQISALSDSRICKRRQFLDRSPRLTSSSFPDSDCAFSAGSTYSLT